MKRWFATALLSLSFLALAISFPQLARAQGTGYEFGVPYPRPTSAQMDSLLNIGIVVRPVQKDDYLRPMYWPRSAFTVAGRAVHRQYMTQALTGGFGTEANIAVPFGSADFGAYLFARANDYRVQQPAWLGWKGIDSGETGVLFSGGVGIAFNVPMRAPRFSIPLSLGIGPAFFQSRNSRPAETYFAFEPSIGLRYRIAPAFATVGRVQASWLTALNENNRDMGSWSFSLGLEVALALQTRRPLQIWVPPLVVNAQDVIRLLARDQVSPVNLLDRNLDFVNTELKPIVAMGWYDLGFFGEVQGTVEGSSRASSGNVTALDIRIDSANRRGFKVTRISSLVDPELAAKVRKQSNLPVDSTFLKDTTAMARVAHGDYATRPADDLGTRYLRVEIFPQSKNALQQIPKVGSKVDITGDIRWDGDGHIELHPRRWTDVRIVEGSFLDTDDPPSQE